MRPVLVFGIGQAFSGRYQTYALLFWCSMAVLLLGMLVSVQTGVGRLLFAQLAAAAVLAFAASKARIPISKARWQGFNVNTAAIALVMDVPDTQQLYWADSRPDYARSLTPYLRREGLSVFTGRGPNLLGQPLDSVLEVSSQQQCAGAVESVKVIGSNWARSLRVTGWASTAEGQAPEEIVAATDGIVSGLGVVGDWRPRQVIAKGVTGNFVGFTAYVRGGPKSARVQLYAVPKRWSDLACPIADISPPA